MKLLPCAVRGVLAGLMISIGGYVYLGCENRVVGAVFFTVGLITITLFGFDLYTGKNWLLAGPKSAGTLADAAFSAL